jgi:hypothetical protein
MNTNLILAVSGCLERRHLAVVGLGAVQSTMPKKASGPFPSRPEDKEAICPRYQAALESARGRLWPSRR